MSICFVINLVKVNFSGFILYVGIMMVFKKFILFLLWNGIEVSCFFVVFCRLVNKILVVCSWKWFYFVCDGVGCWILWNRWCVVLWWNWWEIVLVVLVGRWWGGGFRLRVIWLLLNRILVIVYVVGDFDIYIYVDINIYGWKYVILLGVVFWILLYCELVWVLLRVGFWMKGIVVIGYCGLVWSGFIFVFEVYCRGYWW